MGTRRSRDLRIYLADAGNPRGVNMRAAIEGNRDLRIYLADTYHGNIKSAVEGNVRKLSFLTSFYYYQKADMNTIFG